MVNGMNKNEAWDYAVGLVKVDDLEPTPEMKKLIEMEKQGEITKAEIHDRLCKHYRAKAG
ncbi:MAG: antitoxin VbhA family protein [Clostridiales bacterium]|nr:antitoxin VbhA family protein [Clostridiales bacterium]